MKRVVSILLVVLVVFSGVLASAANTEIIVNGKKAVIADGMGKIVEKNNRTFVPVRFLLEYLEFAVDWDDKTQTAIGTNKNGDSFLVQIGNKTLFYFKENGQKSETKQMDVAPFLDNKEGRTYVPLRFLAEAMGYTVGWDVKTGTVTLTK